MTQQHVIFDVEIIGTKKPVFMIGCMVLETKKKYAYWLHRKGDREKFRAVLENPDYTWVGFNSEHFDRLLVAAFIVGHNAAFLKVISNVIVKKGMRSWKTYKEFDLPFIDYDHIDLFDVAPGVMISLKTYIGRLGLKVMMDMPMHHDHDPSPAECKIIETYCLNDLTGTAELFAALRSEIELRMELSEEYEIDLRSKSDAQIAEAILKKRVGISNQTKNIPKFVRYKAPKFIVTKSVALKKLIENFETSQYKIAMANGAVIAPAFLEELFEMHDGLYKCGVGGLHSTHDANLYLEATEEKLISDFDVASYYPNIMMKAGLVPALSGNKGQRFMEEYQHLYEMRMKAKREGNKKVANSLKITLNGTFGKLGNIYCSFYSPDLLLAVTVTGQLNLLCLIYELGLIKGVKVESANTDGITVSYAPKHRAAVLKIFHENAKRTGFEYEETKYRKLAMKDVNNYIAVTASGEAVIISKEEGIKTIPSKADKIKSKGLYASNRPEENPLYLMKNPTMEVCSMAAAAYLRDDIKPEDFIKKCKDMRDFVAIRNVKGGGIQFDKYKKVDDWKEVEPGKWRRPCWGAVKSSVKRKSRPPPVDVGVGGVPFGRVARWYMTKDKLPPLTYVGSGNQVPKTEGARVCMTLPDKLPKDLDLNWYINETYQILSALGLAISNED